MAKRKHPTVKSLRQGQTVYWVSDDIGDNYRVSKRVVGYFMYSHKTPLPPIGSIIEKMPVSRIRGFAMAYKGSMKNCYYSRKMAEGAARNINNKQEKTWGQKIH